MTALSLSSAAVFAGKLKLDVTVIENVPSTATYNWQTPGRSSVSCRGSSCSSYFMPAETGTSQVTGAALKLLLPDGRIAIVRCVANMGGSVFAFIGAMTGDYHLNDPRDCGVPPNGQAIQAEFNGQIVKLSWNLPSLDGKGRKIGETYYLKGILNPTGSSPDETTIPQPSRSVSPVSAPAPNPTRVSTPTLNPIPVSAPAPNPIQAIENSSPVEPAPFQDGFLSQQEMLKQIKAGKASHCAIVTTPSGADVYVDGKFAGKSPLAFVLMQHDRYRSILVKTEGYISYETSVWPNGADSTLNLTLEPGPKSEASVP
jgi:hypothetical protein